MSFPDRNPPIAPLPLMGNGVRSPESAVPGRARDLLAMYSRASIRRWQGTCVQEGGNHVNIVIVDDQTSARTMLRHILEDISPEIGRAHVCTPVTNAHLVCRLLL